MKADLELESWRREWLSESRAPIPDLAEKVAAQSRRLRWTLAAEVAVTIAVGGFWSITAALAPNAGFTVVAVATWLFFAAAWTFAILSRRKLWTPATETTAAFIDLSIRRCRASLLGIEFGLLLYFAEIFFCLAWIYRHEFGLTPPFAWTFLRSGIVIIVATITPLVLGVAIWYRRLKKREVAWLLALQGPNRGNTSLPPSTLINVLQHSLEHTVRRFKRRRVL